MGQGLMVLSDCCVNCKGGEDGRQEMEDGRWKTSRIFQKIYDAFQLLRGGGGVGLDV